MTKRRRMRVNFSTEILLMDNDGREIESVSKNLSVNGIFVQVKEELFFDHFYTVKIILNKEAETDRIEVVIKALVVRKDTDGYALNFQEMDIDSFTHLKNIVMYNSDFVDDFIEECKTYGGFK